jgi:hypothetical protein
MGLSVETVTGTYPPRINNRSVETMILRRIKGNGVYRISIGRRLTWGNHAGS